MAVSGCESTDRKAHNRSQKHLKQINISQEIQVVSSTGKLKRIRALLPGATSSTPGEDVSAIRFSSPTPAARQSDSHKGRRVFQ